MTSTFSLAVVATCCSINMLQTACPLLMPRLSQSEIAAVGTTIIRAAADQVIKQGFEAMRKAIKDADQAEDSNDTSGG